VSHKIGFKTKGGEEKPEILEQTNVPKDYYEGRRLHGIVGSEK
jgi:hypothetical protein